MRVSIGYCTGTVSYFKPSLSRHYSHRIRFCPMAPLGSLRKYLVFVVLHAQQLVSLQIEVYAGGSQMFSVICVR
jgi:hypothetical protein